MLVLSRKNFESIIINDNITVQIVDIQGDKVKVGITAPKDIPVHREEVQKKIKELKNENHTQELCEANNC